MNQSNLRSYTRKYTPWFALGWLIMMLCSSTQQLIDAFNHHHIILKGLGGVQLSLAVVEVAVIAGGSLVVGIGTSFISWIFWQEQLKQDQN
jgi:uncharacterized membrane protein YadS